MSQRRPAVARVRRAVAGAADRRGVLLPGESIVVACSGGPDSTALLDVLARLARPRRWRLQVLHVDHGLRAGSAAEADDVRALAGRYDLPFRSMHVLVAAGASLQDQARRARHEALNEAARDWGATAIALGHTADDQAETVLMRLLTSATPRSLLAMRERDDRLARPLLHVWREDIEAYCAALELPFIVDPSNRDRRFLRSRVRHDVIPMLEKVFPGARRRLVTLAERQRQLIDKPGAEAGP